MPVRKTGLPRFRGITFDPETGELHRNGRRLRLRPQSARVLAFLLDRAGEAVRREELQAAVWPGGSYAAEKGLNACVRDIRRALGDDPKSPAFIETLPGYGYRFLPDVGESRRSGRGAGWAVTTAVGLAALAAWGIWASTAMESGAPSTPFHESPTAERAFHLASALSEEPGYAPLLRARELLDTVLSEFPRSGVAHSEAAYADFLLGDHEGARRHVDRALVLEPLSAQAYATRAAIALYWDGDITAAGRDIAIARSLVPDDPEVLLVAGFIAAASGELESARAYARRLTDMGGSAAVQVRLGYLYYVLGRYGKMEQACAAALSSTRRAAEPLRCRLFARLARGDDAGAGRLAATLLGEPEPSDAEATLNEFWARELEAARRARRGPRGVAHLQAARALAAVGRTRSAIAELLLAEPERPVLLAHADELHWFASLREDPRLEALVQRLAIAD